MDFRVWLDGWAEGTLRQRFVTKMGVLEDECDRLLNTIQIIEQTGFRFKAKQNQR